MQHIIGNLKPRPISSALIINCFVPGLLISLSGSLPLGNLNVTALQLAAGGQLRKALQFALGVVMIEVLYLAGTLALADLVLANRAVFATLQWLVVALFLLLSAGSFRSGWKNRQSANAVISNALPGWLIGVIMSAVNPLQFPFWAGWIVYLMSRGLPLGTAAAKGIFITGAGAGTFLALAVFIVAGRAVAPFLSRHHQVVQYCLGCLFLGMALLQVIKIV